MARLKSHERFPPGGGFTYYEPKTKWRPPNYASFDTVVRLLMQHRAANPFLLKGQPTDYESCSVAVDEYTAAVCKSHGWNDYIREADASVSFDYAPKPLAPLQKLVRVAAGAVTIVDFFATRADAVPKAASEARAAICAPCTQNTPGGLESFFTVPVANKIREGYAKLAELDLSTSRDADLNVCGLCLCPMKLKVHFPLEVLERHLSAEVIADLRTVNPPCWIVTELNEKENQRRTPAPATTAGFVDQREPQPPVLPDPGSGQ